MIRQGDAVEEGSILVEMEWSRGLLGRNLYTVSLDEYWIKNLEIKAGFFSFLVGYRFSV